MRSGLSFPNVGDPSELVDLAVTAEESGWDGFFLWDHLQLDPKARPEVHDPWVLMGAIAARTRRISIGALVTPLARRRPWKLAKEIITLDHLSGGRVIVGIGLGAPLDAEFGAFGEPTEPKVLGDILDESVTVLDQLLRGERVDHDGEHLQVHAHPTPKALQDPRPPIWVAATYPNRRPLARAKMWEGVFPLGTEIKPMTPADFAELRTSFTDELAAKPDYDVVAILTDGHSPADFEAAGVTWLIEGPPWFDEDPAKLLAMVEAGPTR